MTTCKEYLDPNDNYKFHKIPLADAPHWMIEIPEGSEFCIHYKKVYDEPSFYKKESGRLYVKSAQFKNWEKCNYKSIEDIDFSETCGVLLWRRDNLKEYLNPSDWSLHMVDVDNDAAGENWLLVPEGADKLIINSGNRNNMHFVNNKCEFWSYTTDNSHWYQPSPSAYIYMSQDTCSILWLRHTQPEELPFIDDEPIQDNVNHPSHYIQGDIECIDAIKASMTHEAYCGYLKGNVQKYMWRYEHKGGVESLKKAQWYLDRLIGEQ